MIVKYAIFYTQIKDTVKEILLKRELKCSKCREKISIEKLNLM